jgi:hypothetical protein
MPKRALCALTFALTFSTWANEYGRSNSDAPLFPQVQSNDVSVGNYVLESFLEIEKDHDPVKAKSGTCELVKMETGSLHVVAYDHNGNRLRRHGSLLPSGFMSKDGRFENCPSEPTTSINENNDGFKTVW